MGRGGINLSLRYSHRLRRKRRAMRRRAARWRTQKQFSSGDECSASNQLKGPGARLRGFFQELANRMRTSVRRRRRKRRLALSWINSGFVPPFGRVRTWRAGGKSGSCNTYVVVQVPRRVGGLASRRIEKAVKKGVEEGISCAPECDRKSLYLVLTDLVRLFKR